jgi:hypothetical protein
VKTLRTTSSSTSSTWGSEAPRRGRVLRALEALKRGIPGLRPWGARFNLACAAPALVVLLLLGSLHLPEYFALARDGARTAGHVLTTRCDHHSRFSYAFDAGGRRFVGRGSDWTSGLHCSEMRPGDRVPVVYLASRPDVSTSTADASHLLVREAATVAGCAFAAFLGCALLLWIANAGEASKRRR